VNTTRAAASLAYREPVIATDTASTCLDPRARLSPGFHQSLQLDGVYPGAAEIRECNAAIALWEVEPVSADFEGDRIDLENRCREILGLPETLEVTALLDFRDDEVA
jgi:hypothetical protein